MVASGKGLTQKDIDKICSITKKIYEEAPDIKVCISGGIISEESFEKLKEAGITRIHNNLETSRNFFPEICTTHTYDQKIDTIKAAQEAGMEICSGGLIGLGEDFTDRIDMALELRDLDVHSVPSIIPTIIPADKIVAEIVNADAACSLIFSFCALRLG